MLKLKAISLLRLSIVLFSSTSLAENINFSGYLKSYALFQNEIEIDNTKHDIDGNFQSQNALRLMASYLSPSIGNFEVHYEVQPLYFSNTLYLKASTIADGSSSLGSTLSVANTQYRFKDFDAV